MESFRSWAVSVCTILALNAFIKYLIPHGKIKNTAYSAVSLTVLLVLLSPLIKQNKLNYKLSDSFDFFEQVSVPQSNQAYGMAAEKTVCDALDENKIAYSSVLAQVNINEEGNIIIKSINIDLANKGDKQAALDLLTQKTGFNADVFSIT